LDYEKPDNPDRQFSGYSYPKGFASGITSDVDLELHPDGILIRNAQKPRAGWDEAFKSMSDTENDELAGGDSSTDFDKKEWQW